MQQLGAEVASRIQTAQTAAVASANSYTDAAVAAHTHDNATTTTAGFMSAADKTKLDNLGTYAEFVSAFETAYGSNSNSNS